MSSPLTSWKEIASYLHKGVRTAQRWEANGLPVRRPNAHNLSMVMTNADEIDSWLEARHSGKSDWKTDSLRVSCRESIEASRS